MIWSTSLLTVKDLIRKIYKDRTVLLLPLLLVCIPGPNDSTTGNIV